MNLSEFKNQTKALMQNRRAQLTLLGVALISFGISAALSTTIKPTSTADMSRTSVKITRNDGRSGGTGVILSSENSESLILTNSHVCGVVEKGGVVTTDDGVGHAVTSYRRSKESDLCVVTVAANLRIHTVIATSAPNLYADAAISGHPSLLPNIVTRGHFSGKMIVEVMKGLKKCTEEDEKGPLGILCLLMGGLPEIQRYEAQAVSATIKPGSSGSAIFNSKGEISALVFAGSGDLGYAMAVPQEAIQNFMNAELKTIQRVAPNNTVDLAALDASSKLREFCVNYSEEYREICEAAERDMTWNNF